MIFVHKCAVASRAGKGMCRDAGWRAVRRAGSFITSLEWLLMCKIAGTGFNLHIPHLCDQDRSERRDAVVIKIRVGSKAPRVAAVAQMAVALGKGSSLPNSVRAPLLPTRPSPREK